VPDHQREPDAGKAARRFELTYEPRSASFLRCGPACADRGRQGRREALAPGLAAPRRKRFRHLPVTGDAGLAGIVDITDVCRALLQADVPGPPADTAQAE
jgi:hypothetical protein